MKPEVEFWMTKVVMPILYMVTVVTGLWIICESGGCSIKFKDPNAPTAQPTQ